MSDHKSPTVPPPSGEEPVFLHDLIHKLQTAARTRPVPVGPNTAELLAVPVLVAIRGEGRLSTVVNPSSWKMSAMRDGTEYALVLYAPVTRDEAEELAPHLVAEVEKLRKFKEYVHARLDAAGIEKDPDGPHKEQGCRIGGRLDLVLGVPTVPVQIEQGGTAVTPGVIPELAHLPPEVFAPLTDRPAGSFGKEVIPGGGNKKDAQ